MTIFSPTSDVSSQNYDSKAVAGTSLSIAPPTAATASPGRAAVSPEAAFSIAARTAEAAEEALRHVRERLSLAEGRKEDIARELGEARRIGQGDDRLAALLRGEDPTPAEDEIQERAARVARLSLLLSQAESDASLLRLAAKDAERAESEAKGRLREARLARALAREGEASDRFDDAVRAFIVNALAPLALAIEEHDAAARENGRTEDSGRRAKVLFGRTQLVLSAPGRDGEPEARVVFNDGATALRRDHAGIAPDLLPRAHEGER